MERKLIIAAKKGDREAFSRLVRTYLNKIYKTAYFFLKNVDDAQDVCQITFINAYRHIKTFNETQSFFPYLYRIAKNTCINHLRKKHSIPLPDPEQIESDPEYSPEQTAIKNYTIETVNRALARLPENSKEILMLKYWNDLSYREIAEALSIPEGTVMSRLFYAREKLKNTIIQLEDSK